MVLLLLVVPMLASAQVSPSPSAIKFQASFTPFDTSVTKARLEESGTIVVPDLVASAVPCGANRCVTFLRSATQGQTLGFKVIVANAVGQEVASNEVTFLVPPPPLAPTLTVSVVLP